MTTNATETTAATLNLGSLRSALNHALQHGRAWYVYLYRDGDCATLNPWSDSEHIRHCGCALLAAAETTNLTAADELIAAANHEARAEMVDNLIDNLNLEAEAAAMLEQWAAEEAEAAAV